MLINKVFFQKLLRILEKYFLVRNKFYLVNNLFLKKSTDFFITSEKKYIFLFRCLHVLQRNMFYTYSPPIVITLSN